MTDEIPVLTQAEAAAKAAVDSAKAAALAQINKQESWVKANKKALIIGAAIALILGFIAGKAFAQTAGNTATWTWGAVTQYTDGTAIPSTTPVTYNLYTGAKGAESATATQAGISATTDTTSGYAAGQTICGYLTAVANGKEGMHSNEACKSFPFLAPGTAVLTVQ